MDMENKIKPVYFALKINVNSSLWSFPSSKDESDLPGQEDFGTYYYEEEMAVDSEPILLYGTG